MYLYCCISGDEHCFHSETDTRIFAFTIAIALALVPLLLLLLLSRLKCIFMAIQFINGAKAICCNRIVNMLVGCLYVLVVQYVCTMQSQKNAKQAESENNNLPHFMPAFSFLFLLFYFIFLSFACCFLDNFALFGSVWFGCVVYFVLVSSSFHIRHITRSW